MNSNQIQIESSVPKSNPTRANLIWIYLLTSLIASNKVRCIILDNTASNKGAVEALLMLDALREMNRWLLVWSYMLKEVPQRGSQVVMLVSV
jgi:hypothetical protein